MLQLREAILKTLLYADIFDFPLSETEIAHYLIEYQASPAQVHTVLTQDPELMTRVDHRDGFYCLAGRADIIRRRRLRVQEAERLWPLAHRWARVLAHLPFVRAVMVTGALAVDNPQRRDDIDYLIVTQPGRLWLARALITSVVRVAALSGTRLCPNYLLAETVLGLDEHNLFTAHELAQMTPLFGRAAYTRMRAENRWSEVYLPQAHQPLRDGLRDDLGRLGALLKQGAEQALTGQLGERLEQWIQARKVAQLWREAPPGADRVFFSPDVCKGHFDGHGRRIVAQYANRLAEHGLNTVEVGQEISKDAPVGYAIRQRLDDLSSQNGDQGSKPYHANGSTQPSLNGHHPSVAHQHGSNRLTIGFDATTLRGTISGVGFYTSHLLSHLLMEDPGFDYLLLSNRPIDASPSIRRLDERYTFPNRTIWMQTILPWALRAERPALCHFTNSIAPIPTSIPQVITIHDMTLSLFPRLHPLRKHIVTRPLIPVVARQAAAIITVSQSARRDIVRILRVPEDKVHVIYEAAAPIFQPVSAARLAQVRDQYGLHGRYILYVGTIEPRKNLVRLIEAYARLRVAGLPHQLLLVGQPGWDYQPIYKRIESLGLKRDVIFTGYVPSDDLVALYNLADVFAFPSLYEGFGLPIVEAMACGTPVVTTHASSLGEVAGDAALTVDPASVDDLAVALERVLTDPSLAQTLRDRGLTRASQLSWTETARQTLAVYRQVLAQDGHR